MIIKKWNPTGGPNSTGAWEAAYPLVDVDSIVATGEPGSTTFLRGDGAWASVDSGNQFVNISGDTMTGELNLPSYVIDTDFYHTWTKKYIVNTTTPATLLYKDGNALPNGGVYRFTAHIAGTGTDNMAQAVFWNANGTWKVNVTGQSGISSNNPEFVVSGGVPKLTTDHSSNYTISVFSERMELEEGTGTDNAQFAFGAGSFLGSVNGVLRYNSGGGSDYTAGSTVWHSGNSADPDTKVSKSGDTMTATLTISAAKTTDDPLLKLVSTATGDADAIIELEANDTGEAGIIFKNPDNTNSSGWFLGSGDALSEDFYLYDRQNSTPRLVVGHDGNVGIGTTNPLQKLQVNGDITVDRNATGSGATITLANGSEVAGNYSSLMFGNVNAHNNYRKGGIAYRTDGQGYGRGDIYFLQRTDANSGNADLTHHAMVIKNDGKVGIGTDSPTEKLTVYGDSNTSENSPVTFIKHNFTGTHGFGLSISRDNSDIAALALGSNSSNHGIVVANNTDLVLSTISSGVINSGMTVKTSGNVGIGTTSPETKLKVLDTVNYTSPTLGTNSGSFSVIKTDSAADQVGDYGLLMGISGSGWSWLQAQRVDGTATAYALNLQPSGGNVGIGTTSPSQKLEVNGNIRTSSSLLAGANLYLNDDNTATDTSIYFGDAASDTAHRLFFDDSAQEFNFSNSLSISGNVRPTGWVWASGNFHTNGSLYLNYDNTAANSYVFFGDAASDNAHYLQFSDATQKFTLTDDLIVTGDVTVNGSFTMVDTNTQTTEQWNVTNDGTGPAVTINQTGSQPVMRVQDDDTTVFEIVDGGNTQISNAKELTFLMNGQTYGSSLYVDSSDNTLLNARGGAGKTLTLRTYSGSAWNTGIVMDDAGNVGIGTTSPSAKLDVAGSARFDGPVNVETNSTASRAFYVSRVGTTQALRFYTTDNISYIDTIQDENTGIYGSLAISADMEAPDSYISLTGNTIRLSGDVGIGTASPGVKLQVQANTSSPAMYIGNSNAGGYSSISFRNQANTSNIAHIGFGNASAGNTTLQNKAFFGTIGANDAVITTSDTVRMTVASGGNVGIGTTTPGTKLDVNGNIQANTYYDRNDTNYYVNPASTSVLNVVDANRILSENVTTTPDEIGNIKIARLHESTTSTAIGSIDNLDTFILSKTDGGYGSGTKPSGSNNAFGVISLQTHTGNYFSQIGFESTGNNAYLRSASNSTSYSGWQKIFHDGYHPNADKLTTARTIAGVSFDGTANISLNNNAITNGAGYTTNTGTVTNVTGGTGVDVTNGTTTPSITLDLSEFTSMTDDINGLADELILLDGGAERRKTISSIKLSQFNNDAGWSSRRPVTAGGNSLASSESLDFIAGTGITISESGGDVTISASSSGEPEWEYVTKVSGANPLTYSGMDALSNYEYKFVVEVVTTAEDNSNPYIRINNDSTTGETSYQYTRVQQTTLTGETETHNGNANSNLIYTGLALSSYSNGGTSVSTVHNAEFIYTISPYSSSPGIYTGIVDGWGSTHYSSQSGTAYDGMVQSRFTGRKRSIYQTEANRIDYYHDITAGTTDYSEMRVYRRPKK